MTLIKIARSRHVCRFLFILKSLSQPPKRWKLPCCTSGPSHESQFNYEQRVSVWRCCVAVQPRHLGHVSYTLPATTERPAAPKACWGLDRFPTPTQASAEQPAARNQAANYYHTEIFSHTEKKKKKAVVGVNFWLHSRSLPAVNTHWETLSWENYGPLRL